MKKERILVVFRNGKEYDFLVDSYMNTQEKILKHDWVDFYTEIDKNPMWINTKEIAMFKNLGLWQH